jgi:virginiamycin B lyase
VVESLESRQLLTTLNDSFFLTSNATPWGITAGPDGKVWFTDSTSNQVQSLTPGASTPNPPINVGSSPEGIVSAAGQLWFTETGANAIGRINPTTGQYLGHIPVPTPNSGPQSITYDPANGLIYFTEGLAGKIGSLNPATGAISDNITLSNSASTPIPNGITYSPADHKIWFVEQVAKAIGVYDPANPTSSVAPIYLAGASASPVPTAMTLGSDGNLWIAETGSGQFQSYNPASGTFSQAYSLPASSGNGGARINGITSGPDGNIYFTVGRFSVGQIDWFNPSILAAAGSNYSQDISFLNTPNGASAPFGIAPGPDGNVWFVEQDGSNGVGAVGVALLAAQSGGGGGGGGQAPTPTIIAAQLEAYYARHNKKGKPIGKPDAEVSVTFSIPMDPTSIDNAGNYQVAWTSTKRVKKKVQKVLHPVPVTFQPSDSSAAVVALVTSVPMKKFARGGQVLIVSPGSILSARGVALGGPLTISI